MRRHPRGFLIVIAATCAVLSGCGGQPGDPVRAGAVASPAPAAPIPASYRYVLTSSCGERSLLGAYDVVVRQGVVTSVENLEKDYPRQPEPAEVPTLADLLDKAESAPPQAVVTLELDDAGLPRFLSVDPMPEAIDDEECYRVSHLEVGPS